MVCLNEPSVSYQPNSNRQCVDSNSCPLWGISNVSWKLTWSWEKQAVGIRWKAPVPSWALDKRQWHRDWRRRASSKVHSPEVAHQGAGATPEATEPFHPGPGCLKSSWHHLEGIALAMMSHHPTWPSQGQLESKESVLYCLGYLVNTAMPHQKKIKLLLVKNLFFLFLLVES